MICLIDADVLVYQCGFSSDANARKEFLELHGIPKSELNDKLLAAYVGLHEPLPFALKIVKNKINEILEVVGADTYECYLTGKNNYRNEILPTYKANRDPAHRPHWYKEIKQYLIDKHDAIVVDGEEADDALGYRQMTEPDDHTCICTIDKDLDCVPGFHWNWSPSRFERGVYNVSELEAMRFFYTQCLTGDTTDNIPGLKKLTGKVASAKRKAYLNEVSTEFEMYTHVDSLYAGVNICYLSYSVSGIFKFVTDPDCRPSLLALHK